MPDISMCINKICPSRSTCKRHADSGTLPSTHQSYVGYMVKEGEDRCQSYCEVRTRKPSLPKLESTSDTCQLELTKDQVQALQAALEVYTKLAMGQLSAVREHLFPMLHDSVKLYELENAYQALFTERKQYSLHNEKVNKKAQIAYFISRTIGYCQSWAGAKKDPVNGRNWTFSQQGSWIYDEPKFLEPAVTCTYTVDEFSISWPPTRTRNQLVI